MESLSLLLSRLSLRFQILLVGAIGVVGLVAVGAVYYAGSLAQVALQARFEQVTAAQNTLARVEVGLLETRREEKNFQLRRDAAAIAAHAERGKATLTDIDALLEQATDPALAARVQEMKADFALYNGAFGGYVSARRVLGLKETEGLQGGLRKTIEAIEAALLKLDEPRLLAVLLQIRRHEKEFMSEHDSREAEQLSARVGEFAKLLDSSPLPAKAADALKDQIDNYELDFLGLVQSTLALKGDNDKMVEAARKVEPSLADAAKRIHAAYDATKAEADLARDESTQMMLLVIIVVTVVALALAWIAGLGIARPIGGLNQAMERLAGGDTGIEVAGATRRDEVGAMARSVQVFKDNALEIERMQADKVAAEERAAAQKRQELDALAHDFQHSVEGVVDAVASAATQMRATAQTLSATAEQTSQQAGIVSSASEEASSNVQTVAAAADELAASIAEILRQVSDSTKVADQAVTDARRTNVSMQQLEGAAQKIGEVVGLITTIANQTNLLALNATIEAARAGEAGKGFAVVASEVKNLASQTARATDEIGAQIKAIQATTGAAVREIAAISETIVKMGEIATAIASAVEEQGAATQEIARNVQQAAAGTEEVTKTVAGVTASAGETGSAAGQVLGSAEDLARQSDMLRAKVDGFLATLRSA